MNNFIISIIILLNLCTPLNGQSLSDSVNIETLNIAVSDLDRLNYKTDSLILKNTELSDKFDYQVRINERTLNSISTQLDSASLSLNIFGILFGIAALVLGIYVTFIERKIVKLRGENEALLAQTATIKGEVVDIDNKIQKDIYGLFLKIKREETIHILKRLENVPRDVSNLIRNLLSRKLEREDFSMLKVAYLKLEGENTEDSKEEYKLIIFQHFLDIALKDEIISKEMKGSFEMSISNAFKNDIMKSTEDFMKAIIDLGYQTKPDEINEFFRGLSLSEHKECVEVYDIIFKHLGNRDDRFKFFDIISDDDKDIQGSKLEYGKVLFSAYEESQLSESEEAAKARYDQIIKDVEKAKELKREKAKKDEERLKKREEIQKKREEERNDKKEKG